MPKRRASGVLLDLQELTEEQRQHVQELLKMGREWGGAWEESKVREAVLITATLEDATNLMLNPDEFEQQKKGFQQWQHRQPELLARWASNEGDGARTAAPPPRAAAAPLRGSSPRAAAAPLPPPSAQPGSLRAEHDEKDDYEAKLAKYFAKLRAKRPDAALRWLEGIIGELTPSERQRLGCMPEPMPPHLAEPAAASSEEHGELSLILRADLHGGPYLDFDAHDGWATAQGFDVAHIQEWLVRREQRPFHSWITYGSSGNTLQYFLDKSHEYADAMAWHLQRWFGPSLPEGGRSMEGFENPANWEPVPQCVLRVVAQMKQVLVDPTTHEPLLAEFELAFAQFTRMPVCHINHAMHPSGLAPPSMSNGRRLGAHWDSPGYLEVIVTIGIFGEVDVQLVLPPQSLIRSTVLPRERTEGIAIPAGSLYAIWGKSRWKMFHDVIVGRDERAVPGMRAETARVGCTLRFCRRSFARLCAMRLARERGALPSLALTEANIEAGSTIVEAYYYDMKGARVNEHAYPYTYPALVLEARAGSLLVLYISDGLIPDDDDEAWSFGLVPIDHAVLASDLVRCRCLGSGTKAARMTMRLLEDMETGEYTGAVWRGVAAFVDELRKRGPDDMLRLLKGSRIRC
jgi:hypothetical protein